MGRPCYSGVYWVEFWFEGRRYRKSSGTAVRREAVALEHRLSSHRHPPRERPTIVNWLGAALIVAGAFLATISARA